LTPGRLEKRTSQHVDLCQQPMLLSYRNRTLLAASRIFVLRRQEVLLFSMNVISAVQETAARCLNRGSRSHGCPRKALEDGPHQSPTSLARRNRCRRHEAGRAIGARSDESALWRRPMQIVTDRPRRLQSRKPAATRQRQEQPGELDHGCSHKSPCEPNPKRRAS
jgi:hypothetical protein